MLISHNNTTTLTHNTYRYNYTLRALTGIYIRVQYTLTNTYRKHKRPSPIFISTTVSTQ